MLAEIADYDWGEAFAYAGEPDGFGWANVDRCEGDEYVSADPFTREDVVEIIAKSDGYNDGDEWIGVFRLSDGRFAYLAAGCDYTGWVCQASGAAVVSASLSRLLQFAVPERDLERLGLERDQ